MLREVFSDVTSDDPVEFYSEIGSVYHALAFSYLFWPPLLELHGAVFRDIHGDSRNYIVDAFYTPKPLHDPDGSWQEEVDSFNLLEVEHCFRSEPVTPQDDMDEVLNWVTEIVVETWSARLRHAYPDRVFSVQELDESTQMGIGVAVRQEAPRLTPPPGWDSQRRCILGAENQRQELSGAK